MEKKTFTSSEAADYCNVTSATIVRWVNSGLLKSEKTVGGHRRILKDELLKFWQGINSGDVEKTRILVIDDESFIVDFFKEAIEKIDSSITVKGAYNGFEAGEMVHIFHPHIVFLDLVMKGMNGFEVCRKIKGSPETSNINVIAITGYPSQNNIEEIKDCGAIDVLEKPINIADIRQVLINLLQVTEKRAGNL